MHNLCLCIKIKVYEYHMETLNNIIGNELVGDSANNNFYNPG